MTGFLLNGHYLTILESLLLRDLNLLRKGTIVADLFYVSFKLYTYLQTMKFQQYLLTYRYYIGLMYYYCFFILFTTLFYFHMLIVIRLR